MNEKFDESSLNEQAINDVETARLALRWALDKIRTLHEEDLKVRQNLQEKSSQVAFLENQLKTKNSEIERSARVHEDEMKSRQESLEYQFRSRLERLTEREKELEDKLSRNEEILKQKEARLQEEYQKKSEEMRGRWAQVEGELWQVRQEQLAKQQEAERTYGARLEEEKSRLSAELRDQKAALEASYRTRTEELERREKAITDELRKQEAVLKWAKDSWQKDAEERERGLKQKDLEVDKKLLEKNQEIDDYKVRVSLLEKQLKEFPEAVRRRDEDLTRYKDAISSLESVIRTLEEEKKQLQASYEGRLAKAGDAVESEKARFREMEAEIPKRLKIAVEHERNRFAEKLQEIERGYREDLGKKQDEIEYLQRNLRTFEETIKTLQAEREAMAHKADQLQTAYNVKQEEFSFREKQLQSEYDVRLKVEMEKHTASLRSEIETAGRIYEDSLKLKVEEISHLRKEIEDLSRDKSAAKEQIAAARRDLESANERAVAEQAALRARLKGEYDQKLADEAVQAEKRHALEKQKFSDELERRSAEFAAEVGRKEDEINSLRLSLQKAGEEFKLLRAKASEELKAAVAEERARGAAELDDRTARLAETIRLREDKIAELNRAIEAAKLEREELMLLERERLQRAYAEKEKAMDEELAARDAELLRGRDALNKAAVDKEAAAAAFAAERRALEGKLAAANEKLTEEEAASVLKLETAVRREAERYGEIIERKNHELDAAAQLRQNQDDAYRRTLEEFRSKLADALGKFETLKKTAEDRQVQIAALQAELAQERKQAVDQGSSLAARLSEREKLYRELRAEYDDFKETFEEEVKLSEKNYNDVMLKLRAAEEQKAARDKQIDALKRDGELLRLELSRRDQEISSMKDVSAKESEETRRELHNAVERKAQEYAQKEKALLADLSALRELANAKDIQMEKLRGQTEELRAAAERLKGMLEEERARKTEIEHSDKAAMDEYEKSLRELSAREKAEVSELLSIKKALAAKGEEVLELKAAMDGARQALERLKASYDEEKRRRIETEASILSSRSALQEKTEELVSGRSDIEALKHSVERLKKAFEDERRKRAEAELLAETTRSALRDKQEEFLKTQKLVEQLKDKFRVWKTK
jgi:chromosome segregation ATPase